MSEWKKTTLSKHIEVINGFAFKSKNFLDTQENNSLPVIKIKNIANGDVNLNSVHYHKYDDSLSKYLIKKGDILIALTGNHPQAITQVVGQTSRYKLSQKALLNQRVAKIVAKDTLYHDFLYYFLKDEWTHNYLANQSSGSANQANISKKDIEALPISLPPFQEQKAIAEVLSSLDDKIDLLHRQNKTLEDMAQTLFRQWFIEEAEEWWEEYEIKDFATHKKASIKPTKNPNDTFLHFSLPAFDTNKEPIVELGSNIKSNKYQVEPFSILISKLNPKTPRIWDIYFKPLKNSICSTEFQVVQPNSRELFPFISTLLKSDKVRGDLSMSASGTSGSHQRVKPEDIFNISFVTPSVERLKEFSKILEPNYLKQIKNREQIKTLENLRDTLLPKLMSGEVRIKNK